jgi:AAA15 family ATPase/GTPase
MRIERLEIWNFKSFDHAVVDFGSLDVLIGANASGKSNLVQVFQFLSDIANKGLLNAVSLQGGGKYLRSFQAVKGEPLAIEVTIAFDQLFSHSVGQFRPMGQPRAHFRLV